jgi:hypothetical protein
MGQAIASVRVPDLAGLAAAFNDVATGLEAIR